MNYYIFFRPETGITQVMPIPFAMNLTEAKQTARLYYGKAVADVKTDSTILEPITLIPFGSKVKWEENGKVIIYPETQIDPLDSVVSWFKTATPNPTNNDIAVQIGVHIEEFREMLTTLMDVDQDVIHKAITGLIGAENLFKALGSPTHPKPYDFHNMNQEKKVDLLDSLLDQIVTSTGIGVRMKMNVYDGLGEVSRSNWSKFKDNIPLRNEQGKIIKADTYIPPNLTQFV